VKLILPHVGNIVAAAKPVFTQRNAATAAEEGSVIQQQIAELQAAASANATHVKELAEQVRLTVAALEKAVAETESRLRRANSVALAALVVAIAALAVAAFGLLRVF
jgi:hypothetical protein